MVSVSYWRVYVVMIKPRGEKLFRPLLEAWNSSEEVIAYQDLSEARATLQAQRLKYGQRRAYVQKCGAIS